MGDSGGWLKETLNASTMLAAPSQLMSWAGNASGNTFFGKFFRFVSDNDYIYQITNQANTNTLNFLEGKESFGAHENWIGNGQLGDIINPMLGGTTQAQREQTAKDKEVYDAWYKKKYEKSESKTDSAFQSVLSDEDQDISLLS